MNFKDFQRNNVKVFDDLFYWREFISLIYKSLIYCIRRKQIILQIFRSERTLIKNNKSKCYQRNNASDNVSCSDKRFVIDFIDTLQILGNSPLDLHIS